MVTLTMAVLVVKWSPCSHSTLTIRVRIYIFLYISFTVRASLPLTVQWRSLSPFYAPFFNSFNTTKQNPDRGDARERGINIIKLFLPLPNCFNLQNYGKT